MARATKRDLVVRIKATEDVSTAFNKIKTTGAGASGVLKQVAAHAAGLGLAMGVRGMAGSVANAANAFADFDRSVRRVGTLIPGQKALLGGLRKSIEDLSAAYGLQAKDAADATFQAISAGIEAKTAGEFMDTAARSAVAGFSTLEESVSGLTTVINAWGLETKDASKIADAMFEANKLGVTTTRELGNSIGTVASMAAETGVSFQEVLAATVALTKAGVSTAESMTGLRAIMSAILAPSSEAEKAAADLGLSWDAATLKSKGFAGALEELKKAAKIGGAELIGTLIPRVDGASKAMRLAGEEGAADFARALGNITSKSGQTADALAELEGPSLRMKQLSEELSRNWRQFGEMVLPSVVSAMGALNAAVSALTGNAAFQTGITKGIANQEEAVEALARRLQAGKVTLTEWLFVQARWKRSGVDVMKVLGEQTDAGLPKYGAAMTRAISLQAQAATKANELKASLEGVGKAIDFTEGTTITARPKAKTAKPAGPLTPRESALMSGELAGAIAFETDAIERSTEALGANADALAGLAGEMGAVLDGVLAGDEAWSRQAGGALLFQERVRELANAQIQLKADFEASKISQDQLTEGLAAGSAKIQAIKDDWASYQEAVRAAGQTTEDEAERMAAAMERNAQASRQMAASIAASFIQSSVQAAVAQEDFSDAMLNIIGQSLTRLGGAMIASGTATMAAGPAAVGLFGLNPPGLIAGGIGLVGAGALLSSASSGGAGSGGGGARAASPAPAAVGGGPLPTMGGGVGGGVSSKTINVNIGGSVIRERELGRAVAGALGESDRSGQSRRGR